MLQTIVINFDTQSAHLTDAIKSSIKEALGELGCEVELFEDHDEAVLLEVSAPHERQI